MSTRALIFDVGDVLAVSSFTLLDRLEVELGRSIEGRGPLAGGNDARWAQVQAGDLGMADYWHAVAESAGLSQWRQLFALMAVHFPVDMFDPDMLELADEAKAAGHRIGVLTNDMVAINGTEWATQNPTMQRFDAIVDAAVIGHRKPAPEGYALICAELGVEPADAVFLDDTPMCVDGAIATGMQAILVDTFNRQPAIAAARELMDLPERIQPGAGHPGAGLNGDAT